MTTKTTSTTNTAGVPPAPPEAHQRADFQHHTKEQDMQTENHGRPCGRLLTEEEERALDEADKRERLERAERAKAGQQLYAKIKKSSKYYGQGERGARFPVYIDASGNWEYRVKGGPGGTYRLNDVNLFVVDGGCEMQIS